MSFTVFYNLMISVTMPQFYFPLQILHKISILKTLFMAAY